MRLLRALVCGVIVLFSVEAFGQVGKEAGYWEWTADSEAHRSMVRVRVDLGSGIQASGSGCVVDGRVITAAHVLDKGLGFRVEFSTGEVKSASVYRVNTETDVGVLTVEIPAGLGVKLAGVMPEDGASVEVCGFGGGGELRHFRGSVGVSSESVLGVDAYVIPGDSGGAVLSESGELIGVVSGGMAWSASKQTSNAHGGVSRVTWPVRCGSLEAIRKALR